MIEWTYGYIDKHNNSKYQLIIIKFPRKKIKERELKFLLYFMSSWLIVKYPSIFWKKYLNRNNPVNLLESIVVGII